MNKNPAFSIMDVLDRSTMLSIIIISFMISILSLVVPVAAQILVNLIAFGKLLQPVITLSLTVLILMIGLGALSVWQIVIIEIIQQKLMVKISLNLAKRFTNLSLEIFSTHHGPELVNRFFEIVTIKKSLASLLLYGINLGLQMFFGLILLLFYHPLFLAFDCFILLGVSLIIFIPYKKGLESAKDECTEKHAIGAWLEEILINRYLFKFNSYQNYVVKQVDKKLVSFLKARNSHFKQLVKHQVGFYSLSALAGSLLLGLGGYLVINNQLSLGQLVASEIVLGALLYAFKRFGALLENFYDLKASAEKLEKVLTLPLENTAPEFDARLLSPLQLIEFQIPSVEKATLSYGNPLLVFSEKTEQLQKLVEELLGLSDSLDVLITINNIPYNRKNLIALREHTSLIGEPQWFAGSIYDNLVLNHRNVDSHAIFEQLKQFNLIDKIAGLPDGLQTKIYEWQTVFTPLELTKLMIIRALITKSRLIVLDRVLDPFNGHELDSILSLILSLEETLLLITTQRPHFNELSNYLVLPS